MINHGPITVNAAYKDALIETSALFEKRSNEKRGVFYAGGANSNDSCFRCGGKGRHQNQFLNVMVDKADKSERCE